VQDLKIAQKVEDMIKERYQSLRQFPKSERHVASAQIREAMWELLELVIICSKRYHKKTSLQDLDIKIALLRRQIRLAMQLKFLPMRQYENWAKELDEIGRMTGGWIKSERRVAR